MKKAIVFDIDGTLADNKHRLHFIQQEPKDWDGFFGAMPHDKPIEPIRVACGIIMGLQAVVSGMGIKPTVNVIFCSGRPHSYREETEMWLMAHILPPNVRPVLYMRKTGDHRPDDVVKEELLAKMREDGYEPFLVFDDRNRVVDMWRRNGIQCCQVAPGDF